jgi:serine/threonine protein kinase
LFIALPVFGLTGTGTTVLYSVSYSANCNNMWRAVCTVRSNPRHSLAAAAAASLLALHWWETDTDTATAVTDTVARETLTTAIKASTLVVPTTTHCQESSSGRSSSLFSRIRGISGLTRRSTLKKQLQASSTEASLSSRYQIQWTPPLGEGAFGTVYKAFDKASSDAVALKKISKQCTTSDAFAREMDALLTIRDQGGHPNICGLRENFEENEHYLVVLDLVAGGEMFDYLCTQGAYSEADAARLIREIASALTFLHGIGIVHGDLKPENLMLSTKNSSDAVIQLVDFGCAQVTHAGDWVTLPPPKTLGNTPAYCPPEVFRRKRRVMDPSMDMWALGIILYIMLTGVHPFDLQGNSSDKEIEQRVVRQQQPPLRNSPITEHLSSSALDLISKLIEWNPNKRITALQMLEHPWVRGETASQEKMEGSDKKLSKYRVFKSRLEAQVFGEFVHWADEHDHISKRTSLLERSFRKFDPEHKGYITATDLKDLNNPKVETSNSDEDGSRLSMAGFSELLGENMKNRYFPKGHIIYREGEGGNHMYFINSGTIEVSTKDGSLAKRSQGDFFGEGALLHPRKIRSATIRCITPVHAIEISREYFEKYLATSQESTYLTLKEKDLTRKRNRAKSILRLQNNMKDLTIKKGDYVFEIGTEGGELFILEEGKVDVVVEDHIVFSLSPGDMCGEHSLIFGKPRNTSAICRSDQCKLHVMRARDFYTFLGAHPAVKKSVRDICLRREFQKALVFRTKRPFPTRHADFKAAFDAADEDLSGHISAANMTSMLKQMDPTLTDCDIHEILCSLDLDETGQVSFEEFKSIFGVDEKQSKAL